jgi:membrane fusion protein, multidrug efflux system
MKISQAENITQNWMGRHRRFLILGVPILMAWIGSILYLLSGRYVSTDDAYIQSGRVSVSADISGRVIALPLVDNQPVRKGDVLLKIDSKPFEIAEQEAQAQLASTQLQVASMKAGYRQKLADLKSAQDTLTYQQREYDRQKILADSGVSSQAQFDKAFQLLNAAKEEVNARQQSAEAILAELGNNPDMNINDHPSVQVAQAKLHRARLDLSYTAVYASIDGIVTKVEQIQVGDYVTKAAPLFLLVSNTDVWVEANFKETDLTYMRPGQKASIEVDAYSKKKLSGTVESLSPGTGSIFSLLPPENATGNWVKVVQRLPVRIVLDNTSEIPLKAGLSVKVIVDTQHRRTLMGS